MPGRQSTFAQAQGRDIQPKPEIEFSVWLLRSFCLSNLKCIFKPGLAYSLAILAKHATEGCQIHDSVIMPDARIGKNAVIERAIIAPGIEVDDHAVIRPSRQDGVILFAGEES